MSGASRRRSVPIMGYVGANGMGKSLAAVYDSIPSLDAGRPVLSTVRLLDFRNPRPCDDDSCDFPGHPEHGAAHPLWIPFRSWEQMVELRHGDVIMDEITGVANSRDTSAMPARAANELMQQRRADRLIRWTAPSWARADVLLRETTQAVTVCQGLFGRSSADSLWRRHRLFFWRTYDVRGVHADHVADLQTSGGQRPRTVQEVAPLARQLFWAPGSDVFRAYDTLAPVLRVGAVTDAGRCSTCGGRRAVPECTCSDYVERRSAAKEAAAGRRATARGRGGPDVLPLPVVSLLDHAAR